MKNTPAYGIDSVDHALRLATVLQQEGPLRVTDAAERLGVARSTAHRLLAMLVYRDFAEQDADRRYVAGLVLRKQAPVEPVADMRRLALPHLQALVERTDETANLQVVVGDQVRFVATVECSQVLRVGDREGRMLPAHLASGGRAVLATRSDEELAELYSAVDSPVADLPALLRELRRVRRQGFAINDQATETGVTAIGRAVRGADSTVVAGVSIAMPTARFRRDRLPEWTQNLATTVSWIEQALAASATRA
ncbi:IclR family transcriptional regulator [Pseudonocardia nigra]|uniref:IclR family transcriptional regulator n=1 Tax=Pseudonocardia nigra TaxID=1921578 RepID=UPI001C5DAEEF|nr:IclR family transcriptional regulator [Pseudonocardia nigra]